MSSANATTKTESLAKLQGDGRNFKLGRGCFYNVIHLSVSSVLQRLPEHLGLHRYELELEMEKRKIATQDWQSTLAQNVVRKEDMNKLVMDFFITEGYLDAARAFEAEAGVSSKGGLGYVEERSKIRDAIQSGQIATTVAMLNDRIPELSDNEADLPFYLRQQQTIELIMEDKIEEALEFAEAHLAPLGRDNTELKDEVEKTVALLAFKDAPDNPVSHLATKEQRYLLAQRVNQAILKHDNEATEPRLQKLLRMIAWSEKELDRHCVFPHLKDLDS